MNINKQQIDKKFEEHIKELGTALFKYIYSLVKHKQLAEDLQQDVLLSAYLAFHSFEERASFKSWIFKIATNRCRDYWRKEKGNQRFWQEGVFDYVSTIEMTIEPEEYILEKYKKEEVLHKIHELPGKYREPLLLFYFHQCTITEISQEFEIPMSTVKTRMRRAKKRLQPKIDM
ncbi:RNA polymerase sigma factor [Bacillus aquiflavi]|uniref:RNA polymerase sigma factor n=1 Tax=Bacillus aquiflavi TaxID=2672567 RepID=A0A6B3VZA1_9BACI|nr:RNA polymerase sigma factor [Bacillus aquiflavi]MBA4536716.1 RNA polymerase sigma factor [Bacillus aquiflavi]NEY81083.1 RNA polymerase sigma factor [Bacillus aquiflavi]UAC48749.1 RNA polymerase sigma factor [Bacillus aquiflavi]